ncbi:homoserine dehydrogenase-domain-containing protein [Mycena belliarum]|uniref:Homoserine dehydrogenase n=1 Tax=Mycena belliarum TaxID=1033014 RepID=A0AAD6XYI3_9AGAR|nr:homoserine dehydrogenase-domain-containing protein [Mycena belliae]
MTSAAPKVYVAVVGVGLVGAEFINQMLSIPPLNSPFHLVSLTSTTRTISSHTSPITSATSWKSDLAASADRPDLPKLTAQLSALVSPSQKVALIDNTSSEDVAAMYPTWLNAGISVITPNKKAFSGDIALYEQIIAASKTGGRFLNEATVGAGLPVISTLKDLVATGDRIIKIEGVFSGTMSYIFNEFSTGKSDGPAFSSVVRIAREKGYTEPHPADDLNGFDVARKLTILSRIVSSSALPKLQSFASVQTTSLIPAALENIPTGDEFIARLPEFDDHFAKMRAAASAEGKVLRFVGVVDVLNGQVTAGLEKYPTTHPFATSLGGSDNIIMFHTERYGARPLIVQGAGAGAAVTAMGVLGDLLKLT